MDKAVSALHEIGSLFPRHIGREEGFLRLNELAASMGFPYVICAPIRNHPQASHNWSMTTYPLSWQHLYLEKNYLARNPVRVRSLLTAKPFVWSRLEAELPSEERDIFVDARACGMADGVVVPVHGPWGQVTSIGFATETASAITPAVIDALAIAAHRFHSVYNEDAYISDIRLTDREHDILLRVAQGYSSYQIASVLTISQNSVEWHMKNIFAKLGVRSRSAAVVKAVQLGLISI